MKTKTRFLIWTLLPPPLGFLTVLIYEALLTAHDFQGVAVGLFMLPLYLPAAYLVGGIPSVIYACAMEYWFRGRALQNWGVFGVVSFSTLLGSLAGYAIGWLGNRTEFLTAGAIVGLILGWGSGLAARKTFSAVAN